MSWRVICLTPSLGGKVLWWLQCTLSSCVLVREEMLSFCSVQVPDRGLGRLCCVYPFGNELLSLAKLSTEAFRSKNVRAELWLLVVAFVIYFFFFFPCLYLYNIASFSLLLFSTSTALRSRLTHAEFPGPCHTPSMMQHC